MTLDFSALHMIVGNESPSLEELKFLFADNDDNYSSSDTHYLISKEIINNEYFWIYARYGKSLPYSSTVYNTQNRQEESNPRTTDQIETDKQLFGLYSANNKTFYLSNTKKKLLFEEYIKSKLDKDVTIKAFYKDVDEFIQQIKTVEKVKFVAKSNLFSSEGEIMKIFPSPKDLYGLGMPDDFLLEANYSNAGLTDAFVQKLKQMVGWKHSCEADSLLCIGRDDNNFEAVFNAESFIQKISVTAGKDTQGMYDPNIVKSALILKIGGSQDEINS